MTMVTTPTPASASNRPASLFLDALRGVDTPTAPIWLMRQAGRYLPEYRALKERNSFWSMVRNPDLAAEITLQPVRRYPLDAAILFSDIMTPLPAMGVDVDFSPGPTIREPVRSIRDVHRLRVPDRDEIAPFVADEVRAIRSASNVPLIGFAGAPLTLAAYLVDGTGGDHAGFRAWLRAEPLAAAELLDLLTEVTTRYLALQIDAGVQAVQLFDSWAGIHDGPTYARYGAPGVRRILDRLQPSGIPRIYLAVGASHLYPQIASLPMEAVSLDWRTGLQQARNQFVGVSLQGNLDPAALLAPPEPAAAAAMDVLRAGLGGPHIFNLGHGLLPGTAVDTVAALVDTVHAFDRSTVGNPS